MQNISPFKFLDSFDKEDVNEFFGRERETKILSEKTHKSDLLLLYGLSGTGKTSLVRCGLHKILAKTDWLPLFIRRNQHIIESLKQSIYWVLPDKNTFEKLAVRKQLQAIHAHHNKPIYLIFDQFEELFVLGDTTEADGFFWLLAELLDARLPIKFILILREEYLAHLDRFEEIIPSLFYNRMRVERMRLENIQEVILKSAKQFDIELPYDQEGYTQSLIDNIRDERGWVDLFNLQIYLDRLYWNDFERRGKRERPISFNKGLLKKTGELKDVLARFLDEQLEAIDKELTQIGSKSEDVALKVLAQLVTNQATKQTQLIGQVIDNLSKDNNLTTIEISYCIERLREMRIIRYLEES